MSEQAVATATDDQSKSGAEGAGAQDGLDAALKEFDTATTQTETRTDTTTTTEKPEVTADDVAFVKAERQRREAEALQGEIAKAVKTAKGEDLDVDDEVVEAMLRARADKDARLRLAFAQRHTKPKEWDGVLKAFGKELQTKFGPKADADATEDRAAVRAAVRGVQTRAPEKPALDNVKLNKMSDAEFNKFKRDLGGG